MSRKALHCKACVERSDYFRAARRHKITTLLQAVEKAFGFFDSLRAARDIRAALCAVAVKNPLSAFFVEKCGECSGVKRELAIYPNAL